jgi:predicted dehydrogenase
MSIHRHGAAGAGMSKPFRLALVGAGMITRQSHLPAALASTQVEVTALVDPVAQRAGELARDYGITPRIATRVGDVLGDIDGAVIATPNHTHAGIAVECLRSGVPVLIEKPLASSYQDGLAIVRAAEEGGKAVAVGYSTRFRDSIVLLKSLLDDGYFGAVRRYVHQFGTPGGWAPLSAYNLDRRTAGGGVLVVTGTHFLDRMLHFWGYPDEMSLEDDALGGPEASCTATFRYRRASGTIEGLARYSKTVRLPAGMVTETERGYVVLGDHDDAQILFRPHGKAEVEQVVRRRGGSPLPQRDVTLLQLEDFVAACRERRLPLVDGRQGLESLRLLDELYAHRRTTDPDWYETVRPRAAA